MSKSIKILKITFAILIVVFILIILYLNVRPFGAYLLITNQETTFTTKERFSEVKTEGNIEYQEALDALTYTDLPVDKNINNEILLNIRFKDNFPDYSKLVIGVRDKENWHYDQKIVYIKIPKEKIISPDNISIIPENSMIYIDNPSIVIDNKNITTDEIKQLSFKPFLRGNHDILIYIDGDLIFTAKQQDLNAYAGTDETNISLKDINNNILISVIVEDDNDQGVDRKRHESRQTTLTYPNLHGVYKIELRNNADSIITEIQSSTNKIIFINKVYLASSKNYVLTDDNFSEIYFKNYKDSNLSLITFNKDYEQNIQINNISYKVPYQSKNTFSLPKGSYDLLSFNSNIIVEGNTYFAFNKESLFNPYKFQITKNIAEADYIITNYQPPIEDNGWLISTVKFNLSDLYIKDNKLNVLINIPHLAKNETKNYTIPIDYIELEYYKKPLFQR